MAGKKYDQEAFALSVDPASNMCGVSLWQGKTYIASCLLRSRSDKSPISQRLREIVSQLGDFLQVHLPEARSVDNVVFEGVRSRMVHLASGAILTSPRLNVKVSPKGSFVEAMSWKYWAKRKGATGPAKDVKGLVALAETGWPVEILPEPSDDIADSILIYLCWLDKYAK